MKRVTLIILAAGLIARGTIANAADMHPIYKAPPAAAAPVYDWTGFYLGAHAGYASVHKTKKV